MAQVNKNFCRPSEDAKSVIYAPVVIPPKMGAPTAEDYLAHGWYYNDITPPEPPAGKQLVSTIYKVVDDTTVAEYTYEDVPPPGIEEYDRLMEEHLTNERYERGYTTREPDSYLTSENPRWAQDAKDWVLHRDKVMEYALQIMNEVKEGTREPPTLEEFSAGLPKIQWSFQEQ